MKTAKSSLIAFAIAFLIGCSPPGSAVQLVEMYRPGDVVIQGGFETDPRDHGRPVRLIAAALEVPEDVFRDAFAGVSPSTFGPPTSSRARANKEALMKVLAPHGITNERLDDVSDRYRYRPQDGERWAHQPATISAIIRDAKVVGFDIIDPGFGYSSPPQISVFGFEDLEVEVTLSYGPDFVENGCISEVRIVDESDTDGGSVLASS